jgi:hypothetical protein
VHVAISIHLKGETNMRYAKDAIIATALALSVPVLLMSFSVAAFT